MDVSGTLTHAQVSRPKTGESEAERIVRLAQKAVIEGCMVYWLQGSDGLAAVTSGRIPNAAYTVDLARGVCSCQAGTRLCKHKSLVLAQLGEMPNPPAGAAPIPFVGRRAVAA